MEEPGVLQHLPNCWVSPVVWNGLREDLDLEVVMTTFQKTRGGEHLLDIQAHKVLSCLLESIVECLLVLRGFTLAV